MVQFCELIEMRHSSVIYENFHELNYLEIITHVYVYGYAKNAVETSHKMCTVHTFVNTDTIDVLIILIYNNINFKWLNC